MRQRKQKGVTISDFALLLVVLKWHQGSEGVNAAVAVFVALASAVQYGTTRRNSAKCNTIQNNFTHC